jgi:hypothetical protein
MTRFFHIRSVLATALFIIGSFTVQAQSKKEPIVARDGFWVVETAPKSRQCTVRFYTNDQKLIYQETMNRRLNIARRQTKQQLNIALEQALFVWTNTHQVPADRQWVAMQFAKK